MKTLIVAFVAGMTAAVGFGAVSLSNVAVRQSRANHWVYISYDLANDNNEPAYVYWDLFTNGVRVCDAMIRNRTGDYGLVPPGTGKTITWSAASDFPDIRLDDIEVYLTAVYTNQMQHVQNVYMVVHLDQDDGNGNYPITYTLTPPNPKNDQKCKTTELWLKRVSPGTFRMGTSQDPASPDYDPRSTGGNVNPESPHRVTISKPFYLGVFEVTCKQWELVMGTQPYSGAVSNRAAGSILWNAVRSDPDFAAFSESSVGYDPTLTTVHADSFAGKLRAKTSNAFLFDLPSEAQWEYACRAGTTTPLYDGKSYPDVVSLDAASGLMAAATGSEAGTKNSNPWGFYDMYGNVREYVLDLTNNGKLSDAVDPVISSLDFRPLRGGTGVQADCNRSASRLSYYGKKNAGDNRDGFRLAIRYVNE